MASRSRELKVVVTGDVAPAFSRSLNKAEGDLGRFAASGQKTLGHLKLAAIGAGAAIGGVFVKGLFDSINAARDAEASQAKLRAQLKASGISYKAHAAEIDRVIDRTSRLAAVDDEDLQDAFTNIVRVTGNVKQSLKLAGLAADIARAKHIDLSKAGELVGKVAGGNTGVLSRYGIQIKKGATATEALGIMQKKFGGQAEAYGKTTSGAIDRAKNAVENLEEKIGKALAPVIEDIANKTAKFVDQIRNGTGAGGKFRDALQGIVDKVKPIVSFFKDHPKLIAVAVGAWATYKAASLLALGAIKVQTFRKAFAKSVPVAAEQGAVAGGAYSGAFDAASAGGLGKVSKGGKFATALRTFGRAAGIAGAIALGSEIALKLGEAITKKLYGDEGIHTRLRQSLLAAMGVDSVLTEVGITIGNAFKDLPGAPLHPLPSNPNKVPPKAPSIRPGGHKPLGGTGKTHNTATFMPKAKASLKASSSGPVATAANTLELFHDPTFPSPGRDHFDHVHVAASQGELPYLMQVAQKYGLQIVSTTRSPSQNAAVGGSPTSYHLRGMAFDASGPEANMRAFASWVANVYNKGGASSGGTGGRLSVSTKARQRGPSAATKAQQAFRASQGRARGSHAAATTAERKRMTPNAQDLFDQAIANADIQLADDNSDNDIIALASKGIAIQGMIKRIKKQLKGRHLSPAKRTELLQTLADLVGQLKDLGDQAAALPGQAAAAPPSALQLNDLASAQARLTPGKQDDLAALLGRKQEVNRQLEDARAKGDIEAQIDLTNQLADLGDAIDSLQQEMADNTAAVEEAQRAAEEAQKAAAKNTANADLALAQLTETTADDIAALENLRALDQAALDAAKASGDPLRIIEAAQEFGSVIEQLKALKPTEPKTVTVEIHDAQFGNLAQVNGFAERLAFRIATAGA